MTDWQEGTLSDVADVLMGQSPPGESCNQTGEGIPLLNGPSEFTAAHPLAVQYTTDARKICEAEDLLFCVRGSTTGRMNWSDKSYAIGRGLAAIRHRNGAQYKHFLKGIIDYNLPNLLAAATGSTFPNVSRDQIMGMRVSLPPLPEQQAIAEVLSALDEKIELNRRMNATLEAMARALFKSWFVDFDPVRAKMEGRAPDGLSADIAALFPDTLVDSPLGEIPKGWAVKTLADIVQLNPSERIPKDSVAPYLDMAALPTAGFFPEEPRLRKVSSGSRFKNGDTLLARITPCLENGKTAYVTELEEQQIGWGSTEFIVMRPKAPCPPEYGYLLARDENFRTFAIQSMTGSSGRQRVPVEALGRYEIVTPSAPLMEEFAIFVQPMFEKSIAAMRENQTLSQLRDTLLPKLISGQLRVGDSATTIKEAV